MKRKFMCSILAVFVITSSATSAFAVSDETPAPRRNQGTYYHEKEIVSTSYEWSSGKRVSDNLTTSKAGGSISSSWTETFDTEVSGSIEGLGLSTSASLSSTVGYTLNVGANQTVYMAYRVRYKVETGKNKCYNTVTGLLVSTKNYTIKIPQYGEYYLVKVS